MEANRNRNRGILKGKLLPFYREPKPSPIVQCKKPVQSSPSHASVGYLVPKSSDFVVSKPKRKVFALADNSRLASHLEEIYGIAGDESVDIKAATYISSFQERLRLEA